MLPRLSTLQGHAFERMVREASEEASRAGDTDFPLTDRVSSYWNRAQKTPESVEIDVVAWNDEQQRVRFGSCKRSPDKHDSSSLRGFRAHVDRFLSTKEGGRFRDWTRELALFSPRFSAEQRAALDADGWICRDLVDFRRMLLPEDQGANGVLPASAKVEGPD